MNSVRAHTGVEVPIVQAPMGWIARSQLALAVSNAGGLGVIESSSGEVDACMAEIAEIDRVGGFDRAIFGTVKDVYFGGDMEASLALAGHTIGRTDAGRDFLI